MKFIALTDCPQGQQAGQIFDATEEAGAVLMMVGSARRYEEPNTTATKDLTAGDDAAPQKPSRRRYQRRDLTAED